FENLRGRSAIEHIGLHEHGRLGAARACLRNQALAGEGVAPNRHELRPFSREVERDGSSDIGGCARYDGHFTAKSKIHRVMLRSAVVYRGQSPRSKIGPSKLLQSK